MNNYNSNMQITIRQPLPQDLEFMQSLWRQNFPEDRDGDFVPWYFANRFQPHLARLLLVDDEPAAMAFAPEVQMQINGQTCAVPYIQGVATAAKFQRRGLAHRLLQQFCDELRAAGYPFCVLKPFRAEFYQPLGFRFFAYLRRYQLDFNEHFLLPPSSDFHMVHFLQPQDAASEVCQIYAAWTSKFDCRALRDEPTCRLLLTDHLADRGMLLMSYDKAQKPLAYALYTATPDGIFVRELAYSSHRAAVDLLRRLAHDYREDTPKCLLIMPDSSALCSVLPENNAGWQVQPFAMAKPLTAHPDECYNFNVCTADDDDAVWPQIPAYFYEYF